MVWLVVMRRGGGDNTPRMAFRPLKTKAVRGFYPLE